MKNIALIITMLTLFVGFSAFGAAIGQPPILLVQPVQPALSQPQRTSMLGYSFGTALISVDDPEGATDATWAVQPITLIYAARIWSSVRYWSELYYYRAGLDAGLNKVGQNVRQYGMRFSLQKQLQATPQWAVWIGAGVDLSQAKYTTRHIVDEDGFLLATYSDRDETMMAGVLNIIGEWSLSPVWTIGGKLEQSFPVNGQIKESLAAVTLLYRY